ncbi:hypothetical protein [Arthronema virus TR020]|uniref:Uncharacterized protein n=1 Tax=Arthronema virus TR020 TaxID=2736280 RepID=A0A7G3WH21_9CAUD|nr:hypothetical protein [Arthronema virus TR020]
MLFASAVILFILWSALPGSLLGNICIVFCVAVCVYSFIFSKHER